MKTRIRLILLLLAWAGLGSNVGWAQSTPGSAGTAFSCDGTFYIIRQVTSGTLDRTQLFRVNRNVTPAADPATTVYTNTLVYDLGTGLGLAANVDFVVNSLAYNPQDGYLYALTYPVSNTGFPVVNLYKIGQGGVQDLGAITINGAAPTTTAGNPQLAAGVIDANGIYYATARNITNTNYQRSLFRFDLKQATDAAKRNATVVPMLFYASTAPNTAINPTANTADFSFFDLAINPTDNTLYGVYAPGTIYKFDFTTTPNSARVTRTGPAPASNSAVNLGSAIFDLAGNLFAYANEGNFYSVNLTTGAATDIGDVPNASVTDGASCINPDQRIDVVKQVTGVTSINATTYDVSFAIRVKNTGTVTATNVQVSDFLRGAANNTTFPTSTSVTVSGLTVTNTGGALAQNTAYTGQGANAGLLTGNQALTAGQSALITFTARVVFGTVPNTVQNNTAYASSTSGATANPGYALQTTDGSLILPPGDLLALDKSTNSAALPLTPNGDTPSPSPVYFTPAILGNVFEDANYGGGAGRSQATSNGAGVTGATVELYNATTNVFVSSTTTDAAGNYVFTGTGVTASTAYRVRVVNSTVVSNRPGSIDGLLPVQTFLNGDVNRVGGENPNEPDAAARSGTQTLIQVEAATGTTIQSLTPLTGTGAVTTPASGPKIGVDFGFNFSTVVNTNNSGQGSLRQFIVNSNALTNAGLSQVNSTPGVETSVFMIPDGTTKPGLRSSLEGLNSALTNGVAVIKPLSALPAITDSNTNIDGTRQTTNVFNSNTGVLGAGVSGFTVGTNAIQLDQVNKPEVQIQGTPGLAGSNFGLTVAASNTTIQGIAIYGFGNTPDASGGANTGGANIFVTTGATSGTVIRNNIIGTSATAFTDPGAATRSVGHGIFIQPDPTSTLFSGTISNNLIGYNSAGGIEMIVNAGTNGNGSTTGYMVENNEIRGNAIGNSSSDGIRLGVTGGVVRNNLIIGNQGPGIDLAGSTGNVRINNNTISNNGLNGGGQTPGIRLQGTLNTVSENIISNNYGAGIMAQASTSQSTFSQNSIFGNGTITTASGGAASGQIGIDLLTANQTAAQVANQGASPYWTLNDNGDSDTGANGLLNFPVIFRASTSALTNGNLEITGYAPKNSIIEFFISDKTTPAFGQGQTYLFTATEGSAADLTATRTGNYSGIVNGLDQGSETGVSIFTFSIAVNNLPEPVRAGVNAGTSYITATATLNNATSEFSGNARVIRNVTPLPVTLVAFGAQAAGLNAQLNWKTAQELNNDHFVVERSFDARSFVAVGQVKGQGSTQSATTYDYTDVRVAAQAPAGLVYYRLRQVDTDGTESLSEVQTVRFPLTARTLIDVYPNPATATQDAKLDLSGAPAGSYQVTLVDMTGRTLRTFRQNGGTVQELQLTSLPNGTYLVQVKGNGQSFNRRVIKQ